MKKQLLSFESYLFPAISIKEKTESIDLTLIKKGIHTIKFVDESGQQLIRKIILN